MTLLPALVQLAIMEARPQASPPIILLHRSSVTPATQPLAGSRLISLIPRLTTLVIIVAILPARPATWAIAKRQTGPHPAINRIVPAAMPMTLNPGHINNMKLRTTNTPLVNCVIAQGHVMCTQTQRSLPLKNPGPALNIA